MTIQIKNQVLAGDQATFSSSFLRKEICSLLNYKISLLTKGILVPDDVIAEAERFMERNKVDHAEDQCCPRCLKAHVISKVKKVGLNRKDLALIESIFPGEVGHYGYYLDEGSLIKIN